MALQEPLLPHTAVSVPSLYPVYLPCDVHHHLLVKIQNLLEGVCYSFGQRELGQILDKRQWDCAESVEFSRWPKVPFSHPDKFPAIAIAELGKPLAQLLDSIIHLRHTAVHRLRVTVTRVEQFLVDSSHWPNFSRMVDSQLLLRGLDGRLSL